MYRTAYDTGLGFGQALVAPARRRVTASPRAAMPGVVRRLQVTRTAGPQGADYRYDGPPLPADMISFNQVASATQGTPTTTATLVPTVAPTNVGVRGPSAPPLFMIGNFPVTTTTAAAGVGALLLLFRLLAR